MPMPADKNRALSPATADLGFGDLLREELELQEAERKKKLLGGGASDALMGATRTATSTLFGGLGLG
jgi:hypothetical protein